jgi:hypothetical protein
MTPTVRKTLPALLACTAALISAAGCNYSASPQAATVGNVTISQGQLTSDLSGVAADNGYLCSITNNFQLALTTNGAGQGTYDTKFSDLILSYLIDSHLAQDYASKQGLQLTPLAQSLAAMQWQGRVGTSVSGCKETPASVLAALPADYRTSLYSLYAALDAVVAHGMGVSSLTPAGLSSYIAAHRSSAVLDCLDYIQVATKAKATSVESQLALGANFVDVAAKNSIANNDSAGCDPPTTLPPAVAAAVAPLADGAVTGAVPFQSNYLILKLLKREPQQVSDVQNLLAQQAEQQFSTLLGKISAAANVTVDPSYGSWPTGPSTAQPGTVTPPTGPPTQFVPFPSAAVGPQAGPTLSTTPNING